MVLSPRRCDLMATVRLPSGLVCLQMDLHHLCSVVINCKKSPAGHPDLLGDMITRYVIPFLALAPVSVLSAGGCHTCAVKSTGELVCFGRNDYGQCAVPAGLGTVVAVAAGSAHTCAVKSTGEVVCFGRNDSGQCAVPASTHWS